MILRSTYGGRVRRLALLPPPPLRTVRATFAAHSLTADKPRLTGVGRTTFTLLMADVIDPSVERCWAAPVALGYS